MKKFHISDNWRVVNIFKFILDEMVEKRECSAEYMTNICNIAYVAF